MFSRALANRCTLATKESVTDRPCRTWSPCWHAVIRLFEPRFDRLGGDTMADLDALTPRQREIYNFIRSKIQGRGYGPTVREIGLHFQIKSPNGVMCHLKALQKKGLIHREPNMSRAIQLLEDPVSAHQMGLKLVGRIAAGPADRGRRAARRAHLQRVDRAGRQVRPAGHGRLDDRRAHRRRRLRDHPQARSKHATARSSPCAMRMARRRSRGSTARRIGSASSPPTRR